MVEYEVLYVDDDNIAEAIDLIDIDDMAQHIYFGPQAEILERAKKIGELFHKAVSKYKSS